MDSTSGRSSSSGVVKATFTRTPDAMREERVQVGVTSRDSVCMASSAFTPRKRYALPSITARPSSGFSSPAQWVGTASVSRSAAHQMEK